MEIVAAGVVVLGVALMLSVLERKIKRLDQRTIRIESKLDRLLGPTDMDPRLAEVQALAQRGEKIEAVKRYRELTGAGLAAAKADVERLALQR